MEYYQFSSYGTIVYDPKKGKKFEPFWGILKCDDRILDYYRWLLLKNGMPIHRGSVWGAHVTWNRGEKPPNRDLWQKYQGLEVGFRYAHYVRWDNGRHVWLDVYCPQCNEIRAELGLAPVPQMSFHLTIGRLLLPTENVNPDRN